MDTVVPDTVEKVYEDFMCRRSGIIVALTSDLKKFYEQCDPEKDNLCLYGFPEEDWQVNSHMMRVPPELPEPALGINFARDAMKREDWLSVVALHSESWLLSVAFYYGAQARFNSTQRQRLFRMINKMPTVVDLVFDTSPQKHNATSPLEILEPVKTVDDVFIDFQGRRAGLIKALTTDVEMFYQQCGPEKGNLCLYGFPDGKWELHPPVEKVPPELPEPALGINFARDAMHEKDWLLFVGFHSDAWLLYLAFYFSARFGFDESDRNKLFKMINQYSTVSETVSQVFDEADAADN